MLVYVNSCTRSCSRTHELSLRLLNRLGNEYTEINLEKLSLQPINEDFINRRISLAAKREFSNPIFHSANLIANADTIVISAPFWDCSFPSSLKVFIEHIYAIGLVTSYDKDGNPVGLCKAKKLYYVSTAGGKFESQFGFDYIKHLCQVYFGIPQVELIVAENLDLPGYDAKSILEQAKARIDQMEL